MALDYKVLNYATGYPDAVLLSEGWWQAKAIANRTGTYVGDTTFTYVLDNPHKPSGRGFYLRWTYETKREYVNTYLVVRPDKVSARIGRNGEHVPEPTGNRPWEKKVRAVLAEIRELYPDIVVETR